MQNRGFLRLLWATLAVIFLVIIAGSVVRMTGSGMGCPDWPKCFGYLIPPTEESQVIFQPKQEYQQGQMIVVGDELLRAKEDFISGETFVQNNWEVHEKHDYAIFNVKHTWIEYINRLLGALSGLFMLAVFGYAIILFLRNKTSVWVVLFSLMGVILLGFQAWLGRTVVDSNLAGAKITAHLFGALALVAVMVILIRLVKAKKYLSFSGKLRPWVWLAFVLFMVQVFMGTEVRHLVDEMTLQSNLFSVFTNTSFYIHRSFSWLVLLSTGYLLYRAWKTLQISTPFILLGIFMILEVILGLTLYFFELPKFAQPLHLLFANLIFACFVWMLLAQKRNSL